MTDTIVDYCRSFEQCRRLKDSTSEVRREMLAKKKESSNHIREWMLSNNVTCLRTEEGDFVRLVQPWKQTRLSPSQIVELSSNVCEHVQRVAREEVANAVVEVVRTRIPRERLPDRISVTKARQRGDEPRTFEEMPPETQTSLRTLQSSHARRGQLASELRPLRAICKEHERALTQSLKDDVQVRIRDPNSGSDRIVNIQRVQKVPKPASRTYGLREACDLVKRAATVVVEAHPSLPRGTEFDQSFRSSLESLLRHRETQEPALPAPRIKLTIN